MISKKLNKKSRLRKFGKLFDVDKFSFWSSNCLVGQMATCAGINNEIFIINENLFFEKIGIFYGFDKSYVEELFFGRWVGLGLTDSYLNNKDTVLEVVRNLTK